METILKRLPLLLALALVGIGMPAHGGSYLIQLKNGGELWTRQFWEEGHQVMFQIYGGIAGLPKDFIQSIQETRSLSPGNSPDGNASLTPIDQQKAIPERGTRKAAPDQPEPADNTIDLAQYQEQQQELIQQLDQARKKYLAALGSQDAGLQEQARQEMVSLGKQFYDMADAVKRKNNGALPDWWKQWER